MLEEFIRFSVVVATDARIDSLAELKSSFNLCTQLKERIEFVFIDNNNRHGIELVFLAWDFEAGEKKFIRNDVRLSVVAYWQQSMEEASYDWVVLCDDDDVFLDSWDTKLQSLIERNPTFEIFLICHPNGFSGIALTKDFYEKYGPFRPEFTGGGWEDDDFFLQIALKSDCRTREEVFDEMIYNAYRREGDVLLQHKPLHSSPYRAEWDHSENKRIFDRFWKEVPEGTEGAIQGKNMKFYKPKRLLK